MIMIMILFFHFSFVCCLQMIVCGIMICGYDMI